MTAIAHAIGSLARVVPDFPKPGVQFLDLTPVLADGSALRVVSDALVEPFLGEIDVIAGVEARGFAFAAAAAARHGLGVLLLRKAGKLPGARIAESYQLEYGAATLEVHVDRVPRGSRILLVDDVLATGGTIRAAATLLERADWDVAGVSVVVEIPVLGGRTALSPRAIHALHLG